MAQECIKFIVQIKKSCDRITHEVGEISMVNRAVIKIDIDWVDSLLLQTF